MATRAEREKSKKKLEQAHAILTHLLREDDNKYCADCEAKGTEGAVAMCVVCRWHNEGRGFERDVVGTRVCWVRALVHGEFMLQCAVISRGCWIWGAC